MRPIRPIPAHNLKTTRSGKVKRRSLLWRLRRVMFLGALLVVVGVAGIAFVLSRIDLPGAPPVEAQTTFICDASVPFGQCTETNALAILHGEENRVYVSLDKIPPVLQDAVLAAEDRDFFEHGGVDPVGIARAAWADIRNRGARQGGSTITQQYVKTVYLSPERNLGRKLKEAVMAVKFEQQYDKKWILEHYLNTIYFGRGAYGVQAASRAYFGHDVSEITLPEAALLAGIIRAPGRAEPYRHPEEAKRRRTTVLNGMLEEKMITAAQHRDADAWPFDIYHGLVFWSPSASVQVMKGADPRQPGYAATQYFVEHVRKEMAAKYGDDVLYGGGLRIYTSLDLELQKAAFDAVTTTLDRVDDPAGALVAIDDQGLVKAMMGGTDYEASKVNLATGTRGGGSGRQPGSTFKAFALAEAVREGYSVNSVFPSPSKITFAKANNGEDWTVKGGCCGGAASLVQATQNSVNTVYAQLMVRLGPEKVVKMAHDLGVTADLPAFPSLVLGSGEVSVLDMASAYSTFANQGVATRPRVVVRVERADADGSTTLIEQLAPERRQVLTAEQNAKVVYCLRRVVQYGTGRAAQIGREQAGKTGTTQNNRDAWFAGFTPRLTAVAWMGYPIPKEMTSVHGLTVQGGNLPAEIWRKFMERATANQPDDGFPGVSGSTIDSGTNLNPGVSTVPPDTVPTSPSGPVATDTTVSQTTAAPTPETTVPATEPPATDPPPPTDPPVTQGPPITSGGP